MRVAGNAKHNHVLFGVLAGGASIQRQPTHSASHAERTHWRMRSAYTDREALLTAETV